MKKNYTPTFKSTHLFALLTLFFVGFQINSFGQCPSPCAASFFNQGGAVTPISNSTQQVTIGPGTYVSANVHNGGIYTFGHCSNSSPNWSDTQLGGFTTSSSCLFYNDDAGPSCSGLHASAQWSSNFTGTINVNSYKYPCGGWNSTAGTSGILDYRCDGPGNPATYGNGEWLLYAWNAGDANGGSGSWSSAYSGYMPVSSLSFNTTSLWPDGGSPSDYSGFLGCYVGPDTHSWSAKRTGFDCGAYQISIPFHDDSYYLYVNGGLVSSHVGGCCDNHGVVWTGVLTSSSTIEFRVSEGGGGSQAQILVTPVSPPTLTAGSISADQTICSGGDPALLNNNSSPSGGVGPAYTGGFYTYNWYQYDNCNTGLAVALGVNAPTYNPPAGLTLTRCYVRTVNDACGHDAYTTPVTVTVVADPSVSVPAYTNSTICVGGSSNASVSVNGGTGTISYQWQYYNGGTWGNVANGLPAGATYSNQTSSTMTINGISSAGGYQYRCIVSATGSGCNSTTSSPATLTVVADPTVTPAALTATTICAGGTSDASVTASNGTGTISYQWQYYNGGTWINVTSGIPTGAAYVGTTASTMTIGGITAAGNYQYRCVVSATGSGCNSVTSSPVTLTVNPDPSVSTPLFTNATICSGGASNVSVTATGGMTLSYQWQYYNGGTWGNVTNGLPTGATYSNVTSATMTINGITTPSTYDYRCIVSSTGSSCDPINSSANTLTVVADPAISINGGGTFCASGSSVFTSVVSGGTGTLSYQWQNSTNGVTFNNIGGATSSSYTSPSVSSTTYYRCIYSATGSGCGSATSNIDTVIIVPSIANNTIANYQKFCLNGDPAIIVGAAVSGGTGSYSYLWEQSTNGGVSWSPATGTNNAANYDPPFTSATIRYHRVVTSGVCPSTSNEALILVLPLPQVTNVSSTDVLCYGGSSGTITVSGSTSNGSIYYSNNGGGTYQVSGSFTGLPIGSYNVYVRDDSACINSYVGNPVVLNQPTDITHTTTFVDASCSSVYDGKITVFANGGVAPYTYSLNGGPPQPGNQFTGLSSGTYLVSVFDSHSCVDTSTLTLNNAYAVTGSITSQTNVSCFGGANGSVAVSLSGGIPPYLYSINGSSFQSSGTFASLTAGVYIVAAKDSKGCTDYITVNITQPSQLNVMVDVVNNVGCYGTSTGEIFVSTSGGTAPYSYLWSNGVTTEDNLNVPVGTYTLTVTDSKGCITSTGATVTQPLPLTISLASYHNLRCYNDSSGSIDITVNGGVSPYLFAWSNGATSEDVLNLHAGTYFVTVQDGNGCLKYDTVTITQPAQLTSSIVGTNATCNGFTNGNIDLTVNGGSSPYTYNWNTGATTEDLTNVGSGNYTVLVNDANNCTTFNSINIAQPNALVLSTLVTNVSCNGSSSGGIDLTVAGGTPAFTYVWNTGDTTQDLSAVNSGTYSVTVTDGNGCSASLATTVSQPSALSLSGVKTDVTCNGAANGSVNITVAGGTSPYSYAWTNAAITEDISGLNGGSYSVTITDANSCNVSGTYIINEPLALTTSISGTNVTCHGAANGAADLTVGGGTAPYTYLWSNFQSSQDLTGINGGWYYVVVTDAHSCAIRDSIYISEPAQLTLNASVTNIACNGGNGGAIDITVTGGTITYNYAWSNGATTEDLTGLSAGTYSVTITDANLCSITASYNVTQPPVLTVGVTSFNNVSCNGGTNGSINTTAAGGVTPYSYLWSNSSTADDLVNIPAGTYSVTVTDANSCTATLTQVITEPSALTASAVAGTILCNGGTTNVDLTVGGGTTSYTYFWNNGATTEDLTAVGAGTYTVNVTDAHNCTATASVIISQPAPLALSAIVTSPVCNGANTGDIDLSVLGGTGSYTYLWTTGDTTQDLSGLVVGTYGVTVTDANNCTVSGSYNIVQPPALVINMASYNNVSCNGGSNGAINITVGGGVSPYSYLWSNSSTSEDLINIPANTYSVTVTDANSCTATLTQVISEPPLLTASAVAGTILCYGGTTNVDLTVGGGTTAYTYFWNNGATTEDLTAVGAGTYTVNVTDAHNCTATATVIISQPSPLTLSAIVTSPVCNGANSGDIDLSVSGGTGPFTYLWTTGDTTQDLSGLVVGTYGVTVTDANNCTVSGSYSIVQPPALVVNLASFNDVNCNGGSNGAINVTVGGGVSPYSYLWSNSSTNEDLVNIPAGTYTVTVTDANACTGSLTQVISEPTLLYASVTSDTILCNGGTANINLTVTGGTLNYSYFWNNGSTTEDLTAVGAGVYTVQVTDAHACTATASIAISQPTALSLTTQVTNVLCNGTNSGAVDLTVTGGNSPYSYIWNTSDTTQDLSNLSSGTYSVTVTDANGCTAGTSVTIAQPAYALTGTLVATDVTCNGANNGSINLTLSGGVQPYSFLWSNSTTNEDLTGVGAGTFTVTATDANGCVFTDSATVNEPTPISASIVGTNVTCYGGNDGAADLTVGGGNIPYTYLWSTFASTEDLTGLTAGNYTVIVTDNKGCQKITSVTITQPTQIVIAGIVTNVNCNAGTDGSIDITVTGGVGTYSYLWSNSSASEDQSSLTAGTYAVTVTDSNNCTASATYTIGQPSALLLAVASYNDVSCSGGSNGNINITVTGGVQNYTYGWSNGSSSEDLVNIPAGTYTVTVTDAHGCSDTLTQIINEPAALTASITSGTILCNGGTVNVDLTVGGGTTAYSYFWNNGTTTEDLTGVGAGTYTVIVTDAHSCTATASVTINEPALLSLTTQVTHVLCNGDSTGAVDLTVSGGTLGYTYTWDNGETTEDINNLTAGTYSVTVTDANLCTATASVTISQPAAMVMNATPVDVACAGGNNGSIDITVNGGVFPYAYAWSTGAITEDVNGLSGGSYSVTVTDANGCTLTQSFIINEPTPIVSSVAGTDVTCHGAFNGSADLTVSGGVSPYTFFWSNFKVSEDIANLGGGTYYVIITDNHGCEHRDSVVIYEPDPLLLTTVTNDITCFNLNNGSVDLTVTGGTTPYGYNWSNGATTEDLSNLPGGTYAVTVTDANGCTATTSVFIVNPSAITANFVVHTPLCFGDTNGSIDLIPTGGTPGYTFLWSNGAATEDISAIGAGVYTVTITDTKGCTGIDSTEVKEPDPLVTSGFIKNVTCSGDADGFIDITAYGGTLPYNYSWSAGPSTEDLGNVPGGNYYVTVTDGNGCQVASLYIVREPAPLTISLASANITCFGGADGFVAAIPGGGTTPYEYLWDDFTTDSVRTGLGAGHYAVLLTDSNGCHIVDSIYLTQPTEIVIQAATTDVVCNGGKTGAINLTITGGTPGYTFVWSNADTTEDLTGIVAGTYSVTVTDTLGCSKTASYTLTQPLPISLQLLTSKPSCNGSHNGSVSVVATQGIGPYTYVWNTVPVQTTASAEDLPAGTYSVVVTDANGCTVSDTTTLKQPDAIIVTTDAHAAKCFNTTDGMVVISVQGGEQPFIYDLNGVSQLTDTFTGLTPGNYVAVVTDVNGCEGSDAFTIAQPGQITVDLGVSQQVILTGMNTQLIATAVSTSPIVNYFWSPDSLFDYSLCVEPQNCSTPYVHPRTTTTFSVTVMNSDSCMVSDTITVYVNNELSAFIPTAFTPNNDGLNDRFEFDILGATTIEVSVFDRWGQRIYYNAAQDNGITGNNGWDGTVNGKYAPDDTYVYQIRVTYYDGTKKDRNGTVTLMR